MRWEVYVGYCWDSLRGEVEGWGVVWLDRGWGWAQMGLDYCVFGLLFLFYLPGMLPVLIRFIPL